MQSYKDVVDFWYHVQVLNGGPSRCGNFIQGKVRLAKSRYRRQLRILRQEVESNIAETVTLQNCFKRLFKHPKSPKPAMIDVHSIPAQPIMWRNHFKEAYRAAETPYEGNMLKDIEVKIRK